MSAAAPGSVPELPNGCGSWVCTSPNGTVVETCRRKSAELAASAGWTVETALSYLGRIDAQIKPEPCGVCKGKGVLRCRKTLSRDVRRGRVVRCLACDGTGDSRPAPVERDR